MLTYSADSPDAMGYCDFALGAFGADVDWRQTVREILVEDWRFQYSEWEQTPWAYVWQPGLVTEEEALAWRKEAWEGHEGERDDFDDETECLVGSPERRDTDVPAGPQRSGEAQRCGALETTFEEEESEVEEVS